MIGIAVEKRASDSAEAAKRRLTQAEAALASLQQNAPTPEDLEVVVAHKRSMADAKLMVEACREAVVFRLAKAAEAASAAAAARDDADLAAFEKEARATAKIVREIDDLARRMIDPLERLEDHRKRHAEMSLRFPGRVGLNGEDRIRGTPAYRAKRRNPSGATAHQIGIRGQSPRPIDSSALFPDLSS